MGSGRCRCSYTRPARVFASELPLRAPVSEFCDNEDAYSNSERTLGECLWVAASPVDVIHNCHRLPRTIALSLLLLLWMTLGREATDCSHLSFSTCLGYRAHAALTLHGYRQFTLIYYHVSPSQPGCARRCRPRNVPLWQPDCLLSLQHTLRSNARPFFFFVSQALACVFAS